MAVTEEPTRTTGEQEKESLYFQDPFTDMAFLHTLALHGFKGSEIGECYSAAAQIGERETSRVGEWLGMPLRRELRGLRELPKVRGIGSAPGSATCVPSPTIATSHGRYRFPIRTTGPRSTKSRVLFQQFAALSDPPIEVVAIPYEGTVLPGYFLRPDASGQRRPTVIIGDNASEELYYWVGPPALERGYNALLVDLPGIGLNSFDGLAFRADTEVPVKAVIDYLCARSDVDTSRIAAYGGGEGGGYIMTRAVAHEHRIAACVVDPLVSDMEPIAPLFFKHVLSGSAAQNRWPRMPGRSFL